MNPETPPDILKLLAHDVRWGIVKNLTIGDCRVHELVDQLHEPMNLISYHLKKLRDAQVVFTRRSEADSRDIYYSLDLSYLRHLYSEAGAALHPLVGRLQTQRELQPVPAMRILFVCTHNSARSQIAEGLMRAISNQRIEVFSGGSEPSKIHDDTYRTMNLLGIDISKQYSKSLTEFAHQRFDFVITVCDRARETCPDFPGGQHIHWGFNDPLTVGDSEKRIREMLSIASQLKTRIESFLILSSL